MAARSRERPATAAAAAPAALGLWKPTRPARVGLRPPPGGVFFVWFVYIFICFLVFYMLLFIYIFVCLFVFYCFCVFWVFWGLVVFWRVGGGPGWFPRGSRGFSYLGLLGLNVGFTVGPPGSKERSYKSSSSGKHWSLLIKPQDRDNQPFGGNPRGFFPGPRGRKQ